MNRTLILTTVAFATAVNFTISAFAGANDYVFEPVKAEVKKGDDVVVSVRLKHKTTGKPVDGLKDVRVLTFLSPGIWQKRAFAKGAGAGVYELNINVPEEGLYMVFVESRSAGVAFRQLPYMMLRAGAPAAERASAPGQE